MTVFNLAKKLNCAATSVVVGSWRGSTKVAVQAPMRSGDSRKALRGLGKTSSGSMEGPYFFCAGTSVNQCKIDVPGCLVSAITVKMSYVANPISSNMLLNALLPQAQQPQAPMPQRVADVIRAPPHYHSFWSATRARKFARKLHGNPKHRGTYDHNIRLIARQTHPGVDVRLFIQKVNPVLWCVKMGWSKWQMEKLITPRDLHALWDRCAFSSCEHCRDLARKYSGMNFYWHIPATPNPVKTCA